MPKSRPPYPAEFRRKMIDLVRAGRTPGELSRQFEPSDQTIRNWEAEDDANQGKRTDVLNTAEREELAKLRRENRQLKLEREILAKSTAWFARGPIRARRSLPVRSGAPGHVSGEDDVPRVRCLPEAMAAAASTMIATRRQLTVFFIASLSARLFQIVPGYAMGQSLDPPKQDFGRKHSQAR